MDGYDVEDDFVDLDLDDFGGTEGTLPLKPYEEDSCPKDDSQFFDVCWLDEEGINKEVEDEFIVKEECL